MKHLSLSVIIPCYNEGERLLKVVEAIRKSSLISEIIIVDDGSGPTTKKVIKKLPKSIKVLTHKINQGKAATMKTGVKAARSQAIIFCDADLRNFTGKNISQLLTPLENNDADMVLGIRENEVPYAKILHISGPYGGERSFLRRNLLDHIYLFNCHGYSIEASLNRYFFHHSRVTKVFMRHVGQTSKVEKTGFSGFLGIFKMTFQIIRYLGVVETLYQIRFVDKLKYYS